MKNTAKLIIAALTVSAGIGTAAPMGTAFTYQGRLDDGGNPATGSYDLRFGLFDAATSGAQIGLITNVATAVSNGLFTVTLDFGATPFGGSARWLEIGVHANGAPVDFTTLAPRQSLTPTPYSLYAPAAGQAASAASAAAVGTGGVGNAALQTGAVTSDKVADGSLQPADLNVAAFNTTFWQVAGNAGTTAGTHFLGTTDNQPLELKVNGQRALRLEYATDGSSNPRPNLLGGYQNTISTYGSSIGGGLSNSIAATSYFTSIAGGRYNDVGANSAYSAIGGGDNNNIAASASSSTIAGGYQNDIGAGSYESAVGGGYNNEIGTNSFHTTIGGGSDHKIQDRADHATIGGGSGNLIQLRATSATISGGGGNVISSNSLGAVIAGGTMNLIQTNAQGAAISGGYQNTNAGYGAAIGGGAFNVIQTNATYSTIAGGVGNLIVSNSSYTVIGGGIYNTNAGDYATVPGGTYNYAGANYAYAAGRRAKAINQGSFVWADSQDANFSSTADNTFIVRAAGGVGINKSSPSADLHVGGTVKIDEFFALTRTVQTPVNGSTLTPASSYIALVPDAAVTLSATTAISGGSQLGQILILEGRSDANTVTVPDNANTKLAASRTLGINDTLILMWNAIDWIELSYTSNGP
jgi:hypothetical protein